MTNFNYMAPETVEEAVSILGNGTSAVPLAGGTDLLAQIRAGSRRPGTVMDVKRIPELMRVDWGSDRVSVGAAVPCHRLYEDERFAEAFPVITDAVSIIGGIQIQSRAALGGNLCNSSPSADGICPLIVLGASAVIAGPGGERRVAVAEFCTGPGKNVLQRGELLLRLELPLGGAGLGAAYQRFIPRNEMDIAVAGVAVAVRLSEGVIQEARIALAGVAPTPRVAEEAQQSLAGKEPTDAVIQYAAGLAAHAASPIRDMRGTEEQRLQLVRVLTGRMIKRAVKRGKGKEAE